MKNPDERYKILHFSFERFVNIIYRKIILGFILEDDKSRWLNNAEISNGLIDAITLEKDAYVVGTVEPWEKRP